MTAVPGDPISPITQSPSASGAGGGSSEHAAASPTLSGANGRAVQLLQMGHSVGLSATSADSQIRATITPKSAPSSPKATRSTRTFTEGSSSAPRLSHRPIIRDPLPILVGGGNGGGTCQTGPGIYNGSSNGSSENERVVKVSNTSLVLVPGISNTGTSTTSQSNSNSNTTSNINLNGSSSILAGSSMALVGKISSQPSHDSDSDYGPPPAIPPSTSNNRSRQKKFMKTFSQLPQEEVVLQRYSCALVADILLQGHLYITENYFAFYSNVFGYITKLQMPIRSVIKISKEKTARIIPNAVGLTTNEEKHVFSSLISRDTTFKFLTHVWKRALRDQVLREAQDLEDVADSPENPLETELEDEVVIQQSSESDGHTEDTHVPGSLSPGMDGPLESTYLVKRMSVGTSGNITPSPLPGRWMTKNTLIQEQLVPKDDHLIAEWRRFWKSSYLLTFLVLATLIFLFCSSLYLVYRVHQLQMQVESHYLSEKPKPSLPNWLSYFDFGESEQLKNILNNNVDQIAEVRRNLEKLSTILNKGMESSSALEEGD